MEHPEQYVSNGERNVLADGRRVWVQWTNKVILDEAGSVREILAIGNDITERKHAEESCAWPIEDVVVGAYPRGKPQPRAARVRRRGGPVLQPGGGELDGWKCEIGRPTPDPVMPLVGRPWRKAGKSCRT